MVQERSYIWWQGGFEGHLFQCHRVSEGDLGGVEGLALEAKVGRGENMTTIHGIADHGEAEGGHVDSQLVSPSGFRGKFDKGKMLGRSWIGEVLGMFAGR